MLLSLHEEPRPLPLQLDSVKPLIEYLNSLPQDSSDRPLSWEEDSMACHALVNLELAGSSRWLDELVIYYADPQYQKSRSLSVWYGIARAVARCYQDGD